MPERELGEDLRYQNALNNIGKSFSKSQGKGNGVLRQAIRDCKAEADVLYLLSLDSERVEADLQRLKADAKHRHRGLYRHNASEPITIRGILLSVSKSFDNE